jgi:hypothetical protein
MRIATASQSLDIVPSLGARRTWFGNRQHRHSISNLETHGRTRAISRQLNRLIGKRNRGVRRNSTTRSTRSPSLSTYKRSRPASQLR